MSVRRNTRAVMAARNVEVAAEVGRVTAALRTAIRLSGVSHRHIERTLDLSTGYLTRLLKGEVDLRLRHVLLICAVIGFPVGNFLAALFPPEPPESDEEACLTRGLASLHPVPALPRHSRDPEALLAEIRAFLHRLGDLMEREDP